MPEILDPGLTDTGPDRQTRVVGGNGTATLSYTLPAGLYQFIESVLVQVDATGAGGDVEPELSVATENGVVIATKRQAEAVPAGDTGSATWALRLADDRPRGGGPLQYVRAEYVSNQPIGSPMPLTVPTGLALNTFVTFSALGTTVVGNAFTPQYDVNGFLTGVITDNDSMYAGFASCEWPAGNYPKSSKFWFEVGLWSNDSLAFLDQNAYPADISLTRTRASGLQFGSAGAPVVLSVQQGSGSDKILESAVMVIVRLGPL